MGSPDPIALLAQFASAFGALEQAGYVENANSPISDFAEHLVASCYGGRRVSHNNRGYDVLTQKSGLEWRIQVKAVWNRGIKPRRNIGTVNPLKDLPFDELVIVEFNENLKQWCAWTITAEMLRPILPDSGRMRAGSRLLEQAMNIELPLPPLGYWETAALQRVAAVDQSTRDQP